MDKRDLRGKKLKEIADSSEFWDVEDLIRNFDEEMARLEHGLGHMIWDTDEHRVTTWLSPLPITPRFQATEDQKEFRLKVNLPNVSKEKIRLGVDANSVEVFACSDDAICRPYYLSVDAKGKLDPESTKAKLTGEVFEIEVLKTKKKKLKVK